MARGVIVKNGDEGHYLEPIKKDPITREQIEALKRHQVTQVTGQIFYTMQCTCGARSRYYARRSRVEAWRATQWVTRHGAQVACDLGIERGITQ